MTHSNPQLMTVECALARLKTDRPWKLCWDRSRDDGKPTHETLTSIARTSEEDYEKSSHIDVMRVNPVVFDDSYSWWEENLKPLNPQGTIQWFDHQG